MSSVSSFPHKAADTFSAAKFLLQLLAEMAPYLCKFNQQVKKQTSAGGSVEAAAFQLGRKNGVEHAVEHKLNLLRVGRVCKMRVDRFVWNLIREEKFALDVARRRVVGFGAAEFRKSVLQWVVAADFFFEQIALV